MATLIGNEENFVDTLINLIELDFDAVEAYQAAIDRIKDTTAKEQLRQFMGDHQRHTQELSEIVRTMGRTPPTAGDFKRILTKGKVVLANLAGDKGILQAMKSNEDDTNTAYERASARNDVESQARDILQRNLADERRHRTWLEEYLAQK